MSENRFVYLDLPVATQHGNTCKISFTRLLCCLNRVVNSVIPDSSLNFDFLRRTKQYRVELFHVADDVVSS